MNFDEIEIEDGTFVLVCGKSAGGKTTLLKNLKARYENAGMRTGYVMQDFDAQIVTDKVWHELSFALENLGVAQDVMHRRVAEVCAYFGIADWLEKDTALLSGGQKQLLNLASVMATTPDVLLLDEPTSQLDPISAQNFIHTVKKINEEFGITVVISEHRLEELFAESDRVLFVENMRVQCDGTPAELANEARQTISAQGSAVSFASSALRDFLPVAARAALHAGQNHAEPDTASAAALPLTIREGRQWLRAWSAEVACGNAVTQAMSVSEVARTQSVLISSLQSKLAKARPDATAAGQPQIQNGQTVITCRDIAFAYEKGQPVLDGISFSVRKGEIFAGVGANGSGKSTLLKILCGIKRPAHGKVAIASGATVFMLPQNVKHIFTRRTVREELTECGWHDGDALSVLDASILERHPYDISGGEMQKLALEKILLKKPDIILLDEPTKGLDNSFKREFAAILKRLAADGMTVILTCHDLDFCADVADRVSLFFEGRLLGTAAPESFFGGNNFYTTSVNKLTRGIIDAAGQACGVVREEEIFSCLQ